MTKKVLKMMLICLMLVGIFFSVSNVVSVKAKAATMWQNLVLALDPMDNDNPFLVVCYDSGQACAVVSPDVSPK